MDISILFEINLAATLIICSTYWFVDISDVPDSGGGFIPLHTTPCSMFKLKTQKWLVNFITCISPQPFDTDVIIMSPSTKEQLIVFIFETKV